MQPVSRRSRMAVEWIAQLRELQSALQNNPQHHQAWRWRIRAKVLTYLVLRYGDDPMLDLQESAARPQSSSTSAGFALGQSPPLRSRRELREVLEHIAEINTFKAELAPFRPRGRIR